MIEKRNRAFRFGLSTALTALALLGGLGNLLCWIFREYAYTMFLGLAAFMVMCSAISLLAPIFSLFYYAYDRKRQYLIEIAISITVFAFIWISAFLLDE
ncbi:MAG: hypothetical protein HWN79_18835 [Candidatus Lokiarchaeota archaeon]|nr:hypothetical protein [Candidatus Lokiarchaeota archaeon]